MQQNFRVYLFGAFRFYRNDLLITSKEWHTHQARQLFKLLLTEYGHIVPASRLMDLLWSDQIEHPDKTLRSAISMLRNVLEPGRDPRTASRFVPRGRGGYTLVFPPESTVWIDVREFEQLLNQGLKEPEAMKRLRLLEDALALYRGDYLAEDEEVSWTRSRRLHLRERYLLGATTLANLYYERGDVEMVVTCARQALKIDVCYEPLYRMIMRVQAAQGTTALALQTFEQCREALNEHLGVDPSSQTLALHLSILSGEFQDTLPSPLTQEPALGDDKAREESWQPPLLQESLEAHVVGRKEELRLLKQLVVDIKKSEGRQVNTIALVGEAGVGKSFLLQFVREYARHEGVTLFTTACQALEQKLSFAPLVSLLRTWLRDERTEFLQRLPQSLLLQLTPLLPEIVDFVPSSVKPHLPVEQSYTLLVTSLVELFVLLSQERPLILCLDDLHWADEATLLVVNRLASQSHSKQSLLLFISYRPEDVGGNLSLRTMLRSLNREHCLHTFLVERFQANEIDEYLENYARPLPLSSEQLYRTTQGNALFLTEALHIFSEQNQQFEAEGTPDLIASLLRSHQVHDIVLARLSYLPQKAVNLLEMAAVIGRPFPLSLLPAEAEPELYTLLDLLLDRRFLMEVDAAQGAEPYLSFAHEISRQVVYVNCSALKLQWIHRRLAESMEQYYRMDSQRHAAEIVFHYRHAGSHYTQQIMRYSLQAAEYARRTFSYRQALEHYDTALQMLLQLPKDQPIEGLTLEEWHQRIHSGRRQVYEGLLDWEGILESHRHLRPFEQRDMQLFGSDAHRVILIRSLMGYLTDAVAIGRTLIKQWQNRIDSQQSESEQAHSVLSLLLQMTHHYLPLIAIEDDIVDEDIQGEQEGYPPFVQAPAPPVQNWQEFATLLGLEQAAFLLTEYGWVLFLQGWNDVAEQCLQSALQASEQTDQPIWWVHAAMFLCRVYDISGRHEEAMLWLNRCLEHAVQLNEASWTATWPLLWQAYKAIDLGRLDEAEQILVRKSEQLAREQNFSTHRNSTRIGLGLLALARGELEQARGLLQVSLERRSDLYIEVYIRAEMGMAKIEALQGDVAGAIKRLRKTLRFCGKRSLLIFYAAVALDLAELILHCEYREDMIACLEEIRERLQRAGYADLLRYTIGMLNKLQEDHSLQNL